MTEPEITALGTVEKALRDAYGDVNDVWIAWRIVRDRLAEVAKPGDETAAAERLRDLVVGAQRYRGRLSKVTPTDWIVILRAATAGREPLDARRLDAIDYLVAAVEYADQRTNTMVEKDGMTEVYAMWASDWNRIRAIARGHFSDSTLLTLDSFRETGRSAPACPVLGCPCGALSQDEHARSERGTDDDTWLSVAEVAEPGDGPDDGRLLDWFYGLDVVDGHDWSVNMEGLRRLYAATAGREPLDALREAFHARHRRGDWREEGWVDAEDGHECKADGEKWPCVARAALDTPDPER